MIPTMTKEERVAAMADAIKRMEAGEVVKLVDASYCSHSLCIGDFRESGMSTKNVWRTGMNWSWDGPGTIDLHGEIIEPGGQSEEIDMDWT